MNAQATNPGGKGQQNEQSATTAVGNLTSGEEGSTLTHETMAETGGSGTQPRAEEIAPSSRQAGEAGNRQGSFEAEPDAEGADTAATAINRGYQDTRSHQASPGKTGLGAPETGGNQTEDDLAPPRRD
jgi:hypothetical protein